MIRDTTTGATLNYCAMHWVWYAPNTHCAHCVTAALLHELRDQLATLEARFADSEAFALQVRQRVTALEHRANALQERWNEAATG